MDAHRLLSCAAMPRIYKRRRRPEAVGESNSRNRDYNLDLPYSDVMLPFQSEYRLPAQTYRALWDVLSQEFALAVKYSAIAEGTNEASRIRVIRSLLEYVTLLCAETSDHFC